MYRTLHRVALQKHLKILLLKKDIGAFYRFGRRGGESFDGNNFNGETSLYNIAREYKNANNANNESIRYVTVYSVKLQGSAGGADDHHNDCFFNSLVSLKQLDVLYQRIVSRR